jgi:hypothetical protein
MVIPRSSREREGDGVWEFPQLLISLFPRASGLNRSKIDAFANLGFGPIFKMLAEAGAVE